MKYLAAILFMISFSLTAQHQLQLDSLQLKGAQELFLDDYENIYLYKKNSFSFTKYDSTGKQVAKLMLTQPFQIQEIQNPLGIIMFSENAQELKFTDQNLNEIQRIDFRQRFSFIKTAFTEDLQQIWLLDESSKRLIQYNYRQDFVINSFPVDWNFEDILEILVYKNFIYYLDPHSFKVYDLKNHLHFETSLSTGRRIFREGNRIVVLEQDRISEYSLSSGLKTLFHKPGSSFVDKNSSSCLAVKAGKVYLYKIENQ